MFFNGKRKRIYLFAEDAPIIRHLGWKTIKELIDSETKIMVLKSLNGLAPPYLKELFVRNSYESLHTLRNTSTDLRLPLMKTANGQKCFSFRGAKQEDL